MRRLRPLPTLIFLALLFGCAGSVDELPVARGVIEPTCCARGPGEARPGPPGAAEAEGGEERAYLEYLGVGGWRIRWRGATVLTAPFFSNPSFLRSGLWTIESDTALVHRFLPPVPEAAAVLVGHAHYDHLMDLPHILLHDAPRARVLGSRTAGHLLGSVSGFDAARMEIVDDRAGDHETPGEWIPVADGRARVMPLRSDHAPHFWGVEIMEGRLTRDPASPPGAAAGWPRGRTYAYLVDLLEANGSVALRIYYQDAASQAPAGLLPPLPESARRRVDVAILCPAVFQEVEEYPEAILRSAEPRHVLLGHWEDFFRPRTRELRVVPHTDMEAFIRRMEAALPDDAGWTLPAPGAEIRFGARAGGG